MNARLIILVAGLLIFTGCAAKTSDTQINVARANQSQGEGFMAQGNYTAALAKLLEARKVLDKDPYLYNSLGLAYLGKGREELAIEAFDQALEFKPDFTEALNNKGAAYLKLKQWNRAIETFNKVLEDILYPTPHFPLSNIGWAYLGKMDFTMAEVYFRKSLDAMPWFITASHGLAQMYLVSNRPEKAVHHLKFSLKQTPNAVILHADMARALDMQGKPYVARKYWLKVAQLSPARSSLAKEAEERLSKTQY